MKNKFLQSTFILIIGGFITKILGMVIRIIMTRKLGVNGIGTYMLIMPTFSLLISLAQFSLPTAISKFVAENKYNNKKLVLTVIPFILLINFILFIFLSLFSKYISINLLKNLNTYYGLLAIGLVLPFISISSILRGYFFGKQKMFPHVIGNIFEDVARLLLIYFFTDNFINVKYKVMFIVLTNIVSESISIIIMLLFAPKNIELKLEYFKPNKKCFNDIFSISFPITLSRLIGNLCYFFEPIILTNTLLFVGYSNSFIVREYGIVTGYVMPILLLPSFFSNAISSSIVPSISKNYYIGNIKNVKKKIKEGIIFSSIIGTFCTLFIFLFAKYILTFLYSTSLGLNYIKVLSPIFILFYLESPMQAALQALGKAKATLFITVTSSIIKLVILFVFSLFKIGIWPLLIANGINILYSTFILYIFIKKSLHK